MRKTTMVAAIAAVTMLMAATAAWAEVAPTILKGGRGNQITGMANTRWTIWSTNSIKDPTTYRAFAQKTGKPRFQVNRPHTKGFFGSLDGDTPEAIFQQTSGGGRRGSAKATSDIYLYDLRDRTRSSPGSGVNTKRWEWSPSISDGYILFGRNDLRSRTSRWRVMLFDRTTHAFTKLDSARNACRCIFPGQVTEQYATWTKCSRTLCQSYYFTIGTGLTAMIPNPSSLQTYYPAAAATSDNLYFARSNTGCGAGTQILRWNPVGGGDPVVVSSLPSGHDLAASSLAFYDTGGHDDVFLSMLRCSGKFWSDINEIEDADTATAPRETTSARASSPRAAKHLLPPGAIPVG